MCSDPTKLSIEDCAGLTVEERGEAYNLLLEDPTFIDQLIGVLYSNPHYQSVASWFIKYHLEQGGDLTAEEIAQLYDCAQELNNWEALLHILQIVPYVLIPSASLDHAERLIRRTLQHENKFVRAWAYNVFSVLADSFPVYRPEVSELLDCALSTEAPSVKARIRKILSP